MKFVKLNNTVFGRSDGSGLADGHGDRNGTSFGDGFSDGRGDWHGTWELTNEDSIFKYEIKDENN